MLRRFVRMAKQARVTPPKQAYREGHRVVKHSTKSWTRKIQCWELGNEHSWVLLLPDGRIALEVDPDTLQRMLQKGKSAGIETRGVADHGFVHSIYFREPSGVLFEIATDPPGFTVDEAPHALGSALKLPSRYAPLRQQIETQLPPLN